MRPLRDLAATRPLRALAADRRGVAAVEFAMVASLFFAVILAALDVGGWMAGRLRLGQAVEQGAMLAFAARATQPDVNTAAVTSLIQAADGNRPAVDFRCNGVATCSADNRQQSMCLLRPGTDGWPVFAAPGQSGTCASGGTPGYWLVVRASKDWKSTVVPKGALGTSMLIQTVVRLK